MKELHWAIVCAACVGCEPLKPKENSPVSEVRAIPSTGEITARSGATFEVALQALDGDGEELDGVDCFFAFSDVDVVRFVDAAAGQTTQRLTTQTDTVQSIKSRGVAVARFAAATLAEQARATIWATVVPGEGSEPPVEVRTFDVVVAPAAQADGGAR